MDYNKVVIAIIISFFKLNLFKRGFENETEQD